MIRLYRFEYSTNVERVTLALAHKDVDYESVWVDPSDRLPVIEVSGQELVPVIEHDGEVVADSTTILEYLEERYPEPPLYPRDAAPRAEVRLFIDWFNRVWKRPPNEIDAELGKPEPDGDAIAAHGAQMGEWLGVFEDLLEGRDYLAGSELGAADCAAVPFLKYAAGREPADDERFHVVLDEHMSVDGHPRLAAWIERVDRLPRG